MDFSDFGKKLTSRSGILLLMDDLGKPLPPGVKPYPLGGGNPARIICSTSDFLNKNSDYNLNTKGKFKNAKEKKAHLLGLSEKKFIKKQIMQ